LNLTIAGDCLIASNKSRQRLMSMSTQTTFMAVRSVQQGGGSTLEGTLMHHFDVSCAKCRETYAVWGPAPEMDESLRQDREKWLAELLPNVCPFHRDSFPVPPLEED
jgi:hypothetical protein